MKGAHSKLAGVLADIKKNNRDEAPVKRRNATYVAQTKPANATKITPRTGTYRLKLFDRPVDLGPFSEDASLYAVTRAWVHGSSSIPEEQDTGIRDLPPPKPKTIIEIKKIEEEKTDQTLTQRECLDSNIRRWKEIRKNWINARKIHESRYEDSLRILQEMRDEALNPGAG